MAQKTQLDRLESAIIGNGREGLIAQVARIDERSENIEKMSNRAIGAAEDVAKASEEGFIKTYQVINELTINVNKIASSVEAHHKTEHFSELLKKRSFYIIVVVGFVVLHLVATYTPNVWDFLMALLGLPHLIIPIA
jgi:hypothetical protein